jgi:hypothetical protein
VSVCAEHADEQRKDNAMQQDIIALYWQIGKHHNYPAIADLELAAGPMAWRSFAMTRPLRIADVVARFASIE